MSRVKLLVIRSACLITVLSGAVVATVPGNAETSPPGVVSATTHYDFKTLIGRVESAIVANDMVVVAKASASAAAEKRGVKIPGDAVLLVFRNDYAVRMLGADLRSGIEAPIPIHVFEMPNGKAGMAYRRPTSALHPYQNNALEDMAKELDSVFAHIAGQASGD